MKVSKDGVQFYDIDDSDDSVAAAKAKGYKEYVPMTKNGKDVYNVEFTNDSYKTALDKGYKDLDRFNFEKSDKPGKLESAFRGGINGLTQGFGDEIGGAMEAAGSVVGLRGIGSPTMSDIHLETPDEKKQSLGDVYRGMRDHRRELDREAEEANPNAYKTADFAGSVAGGTVLPGSMTLKGAAGLGAVQGLGRSEADLTKPSLDNYGQAALDTGLGAGAGVLGYGVGKGIEGTVKGVGAGISKGRELVKSATRGAARGAKEATEDVPNMFGVRETAGVVGALKGAVNELKELNSTTKEFSSIAKDARDLLQKQAASTAGGGRRFLPIQAVGNGKSLGELSDDEAVLGALLSDGENPVKQWFATKSATLHPGQVDADQYSKLLGLGSGTRQAARDFDTRQAAAELKPVMENTRNLFKAARDQRTGELQDAARQAFQPEHGDAVIGELEDSIVDANRLNSVPGQVRNLLADVHSMIQEGNGTRTQKLAPGDWGSAPAAERFNRLQQARQLLDKQIKWANREGHGQGESILRNLRDHIDTALKTSPEKVEGDALYSASKRLEGKFFDPAEFGDAGDIDEFKLSRLLNNTDSAARFRSTIPELRQFADRPGLAPEFREQANKLADELENRMSVADTKRDLGSFRFANGPSSPAIERLGSATGGNSLLQDAVRAPAGFLNQTDQFNKLLQSKLGKGFGALNPQEQAAAAKYWVWLKRNPDAGQESAERMFKQLFEAK